MLLEKELIELVRDASVGKGGSNSLKTSNPIYKELCGLT